MRSKDDECRETNGMRQVCYKFRIIPVSIEQREITKFREIV